MKLRLFLTGWIVFSLHFATNVVREHYPALSLIEQGDFRVDRYLGLHSDIFQHTDGHAYIGNQVAGSVIAAAPLFLFKPLLEHCERLRRESPPPRGGETRYETEYPLRQEFLRKSRELGFDLKFGAATVITSVFLMAPLSALLMVMMFSALSGRGLPQKRAAWLSLLFGFGTPVFYRAAYLSHNVFLTGTVFTVFLLVWPREGVPLSWLRRLAAGFFAGCCLALDYAGVVPLLVFFGYLLWTQGRGRGLFGLVSAGWPYVLGSVPAVAFLLWSQWAMFGDPFRPGQYWMPEVNYTERGWRGFSLPTWELFWANLIDLDFGLFAFCPLFLLATFLGWFFPRSPTILSREALSWIGAFAGTFLLFCAANQYSWMQWNTGFRYLMPLLPLLFLACGDALGRLSSRWLWVVTGVSVGHLWVLSMVRYTPNVRGVNPPAVPESYARVASEGIQFPWLKVLRSTDALDVALVRGWWFPYALLALVGLVLWGVWSFRRKEPASDSMG